MTLHRAVCAWTWLLLVPATTYGHAFDYGLVSARVAPGVHVFEGKREHFTRSNGGNIANTGFIETANGVIVIDTGPSQRYGTQMRDAIRAVTGKDVIAVFITHAHPDHFLGNQAFSDVPIEALPATSARIAERGDMLSANLYRMVGGWMTGTVPIVPTGVTVGGRREIDGRVLQLIALRGHSDADLAILDVASGTLFTGDLVFHDRAATTPDADLATWLASLQTLQALPFTTLVPGHGSVIAGDAAIAQTRDYLEWMQSTLRAAAGSGKDMAEIMAEAPPERFRRYAVIHDEFARSVMHLYPSIEADSLPVVHLP